MSAAGTQAVPLDIASLPKGRTPLAHLLHALNQPLTGLQCSIELAVAGPQSREHYVRTLREGLELTCRMRLLVEALRELADAAQWNSEKAAPFLLDELFLNTADELEPVAKEKGVRMQLGGRLALAVRADRDRVAAIAFRCLESALSLSATNTDLQITASAEQGVACVHVCWTQDKLPDYSPFSRQELSQTGPGATPRRASRTAD